MATKLAGAMGAPVDDVPRLSACGPLPKGQVSCSRACGPDAIVDDVASAFAIVGVVVGVGVCVVRIVGAIVVAKELDDARAGVATKRCAPNRRTHARMATTEAGAFIVRAPSA